LNNADYGVSAFLYIIWLLLSLLIMKLNDKKDTVILTMPHKKTYKLPVEMSNGIYNVGIRS
jgi:hypothetical protein